ncbi:MAG: hypothetical protein EZS28_000076 [Streblomastix strix]|uniref:Uncharacterized protein n=1 Tax=Streblomastix strix TaxID=222440 RepID=A0A5J4XCZ7_9EUKA|nr:MAG: hypothetical protein EZS28_000076 [Streblomastix strix]
MTRLVQIEYRSLLLSQTIRTENEILFVHMRFVTYKRVELGTSRSKSSAILGKLSYVALVIAIKRSSSCCYIQFFKEYLQIQLECDFNPFVLRI